MMHTQERITHLLQWADIPRGTFVVRGDTLVAVHLLSDKADASGAERVDVTDVLVAQS